MRWLPALLCCGWAILSGVGPAGEAEARPEFARREGKACGYCHINPRGGGARNGRGLLYARNDFRFPVQAGDLSDFAREKDREAMVRARKLIGLAHVREAVAQLEKLQRSVRDERARRLVEQELHDLDVKGTEILGQARRLLRRGGAEEAVELLVMLEQEYADLDVGRQARDDLREIRGDKDLREILRREQREEKARLLYLEALTLRLDGHPEKASETLSQVVERHSGTRAAELAKEELAASERSAQTD